MCSILVKVNNYTSHSVYPPLTGGIKATSSPAFIFPFSSSTYSKFTATAIDDKIFFSLSFECRDSRMSKSSEMEIESVDSGNRIFSLVIPVASFTDAK